MTAQAVRPWVVLALGSGVVVYGLVSGTAAWITAGFSVLGVEPLARAATEPPPK